MLKMGRSNQVIVVTILLSSLTLIAAAAQDAAPAPVQEEAGRKLILNIYLDETGKALVTGYAHDLSGLPFLSTSTYRYENDTMQLYALTDALTYKDGDLWSLKLQSGGYYDDYHLTFYLPSDLGLKGINSTAGLQYLLSASNQSLVMDVHGYDVDNPGVMIDYQQPLQNGHARNDSFYLFALVLALLLSLGFASYFLWKRHDGDGKWSLGLPQISEKSKLENEIDEPENEIDNTNNTIDPARNGAGGSDESRPLELTDMDEGLIQSDDIEPFNFPSTHQDGSAEETSRKEIEVTSEMKAVMETLTPRERAILEVLINAGGKIDQSDLRYETKTPKSSLSGILLSLERRKIIIKDKSGRKNAIELSNWFISKKEH
ncbi:MAG: hypothetical protein LUQ44_02645 [Methanothrix sp.]|nr:hypothetical protein [Methanothrix sp.]